MNILDRVIGYIAPAAAARRLQARATLQQIMAMSAAPNNIYPQAKTTRTNKVTLSVYKENEASSAVTDNLRAQSWRLYRTNPSARKIVRTLQSKVIGRGMHPEPLAMNADGTPNEAFRDRCKELWKRLNAGFDSRGLPAQGGQTLAGLQRVALQAVILSGDALFRMKPITQAEQIRRDLPIPLTLQLIDSCRLADETEVTSAEIPGGSSLFRGIELDEENRRTAYYIRLQPAYASANQSGNAVRIPADQMGHLYVEEDIDQLRGVPWFSAALTRTQDTADLEYNVLKSTALAACVVGAYAKPTGATKFGLNASTTAPDDLTDGDGNTVTKLQPGLLVNTGRDGKFELHSPNQPNMNPEAFVQHLQRGTATAVPGVKSSTITGDYRNSSFSSERSADNDIWPELHDVQQWFADNFCQPVYEAVIRAAMVSGFFDDLISPAEFMASPGRFMVASWNGPIALSINPVDDAKAAHDRIKGGLSSLQMECAKLGTNWRDVLANMAEVYEVASRLGIPPEILANIMGLPAPRNANEAADSPTGTDDAQTT